MQQPPRPVRAHLLDERRRAEAARLAALAISQRGFCVCRGELDGAAVADAGRELRALFSHGVMRPGGFTIGGRDNVVKAKRDDHTLWLHEYLSAVGGPDRGGVPTLQALDGVLAAFGEAVIDALAALDRPSEPMGRAGDGSKLHYAGRTDLMLACYPGDGAHYGPHIDNGDGDGREALDYGRCFTLVYYLNDEDWDASAKGGALRVHLPPRLEECGAAKGEGEEVEEDRSSDGLGGVRGMPVPTSPRMQGRLSRLPHDALDVPPRGDTLVLFRADKVLHEVRPAQAARVAATCWFYAGSAQQSARARESERREQQPPQPRPKGKAQ